MVCHPRRQLISGGLISKSLPVILSARKRGCEPRTRFPSGGLNCKSQSNTVEWLVTTLRRISGAWPRESSGSLPAQANIYAYGGDENENIGAHGNCTSKQVSRSAGGGGGKVG